MASYIRRREFLATLLGSAAAWPLAASAQAMRQVGVLMGLVAGDPEALGSRRTRTWTRHNGACGT